MVKRAGVITRLQPRWEFRGSSDWITSVDEIPDELVFVGSRDGRLYVLNRHGAEIANYRFDSWVGALKVIDVRPHRSGRVNDAHLLVGTKRGEITCLHVCGEQEDRVVLTRVFTHRAGNTIREIDAVAVEDDFGGDYWVAVGSEDRHVYRFNLSDILNEGDAAPVRSVSVNGWLRSVAFTRDPSSEQPVVAAGCGDKHLYFLSEQDFAAELRTPRRILVYAKVHSIVADKKSSTIFCSSDAKRLSVVGWTGESYAIVHETPLPHRATRLAFADPSYETILAACEDGNIYVYDIATLELTSYIPVGERMFAIRGATGLRAGLIMLGHAHGRLSCCVYSLRAGIPDIPQQRLLGSLSAFVPNDFSHFAELLLFGPKRAELNVGISRFLHLTRHYPNASDTCVVGTDEGSVVVIRLDPFQPKVIHRESFAPTRVWAVHSEWQEEKRLRVMAATSESEIVSLLIDFAATPATVVERTTSSLDDWPREIREVECDEAHGILVCCENGDVRIHDADAVHFNTGQTLRTGYARRVGSRYELLTGSDDALITRFAQDQELWRRDTLDRVREVLMCDDECLAVSEDRFLYILDHDGGLRQRYRFPHRALCIDVLTGAKGRRQHVVGCGDGFVYLLEPDGTLCGSYKFPDRIRDVKVIDGKRLAVACEDGNVYFAPTMETFLSEHYATRPLGAVEARIKELRRATSESDVSLEVKELSEWEQLALLSHIEHWFIGRDAELAIALVDAVEASVRSSELPRWRYIIAHALVFVAQRVNLAAGRSRIDRFMRASQYDAYALHAFLCSIPAAAQPAFGAKNQSRALVDAIVVNTPIEDDWIREELLRQLQGAEFFSLGPHGFCEYFCSIRISFNELRAIVAAASENEQADIAQSPLVQLLALLSEPEADVRWIERMRSIATASCEPLIARHLCRLEDLVVSAATPETLLRGLDSWVAEELTVVDAVAAIRGALNSHSWTDQQPAAMFTLLADVIQGQLSEIDCRVSAAEYLTMLFVRGFVMTIGARCGATSVNTD